MSCPLVEQLPESDAVTAIGFSMRSAPRSASIIRPVPVSPLSLSINHCTSSKQPLHHFKQLLHRGNGPAEPKGCPHRAVSFRYECGQCCTVPQAKARPTGPFTLVDEGNPRVVHDDSAGATPNINDRGFVALMAPPARTVKRLLEERRTVQWLTGIPSGRPTCSETTHPRRGDAVDATAIIDLDVGRTRKDAVRHTALSAVVAWRKCSG